MYNIYKVVVTFDTGLVHTDDVGGEWKTAREAARRMDVLVRGPASCLVTDVKAIDALDCTHLQYRRNEDGRFMEVRA